MYFFNDGVMMMRMTDALSLVMVIVTATHLSCRREFIFVRTVLSIPYGSLAIGILQYRSSEGKERRGKVNNVDDWKKNQMGQVQHLVQERQL